MFDALQTGALAAFDRIVVLDLDDVGVDGSLHKAPYGGEGTDPNPTDRAKLGWKWSVASERHGIPLGWAIDGAHRNDVRLLEPTLDTIDQAGLLADIGVLHLDRGYDSPAVRDRLRVAGIDQFELQRRGTKVLGVKRQPLRLGLHGSSRPPPPGGQTMGSSAATPTAAHAIATLRSAWPQPSTRSPTPHSANWPPMASGTGGSTH